MEQSLLEIKTGTHSEHLHTRLGHAKDLILDVDKLNHIEDEELILSHLDLLDDALILRFFNVQNGQLVDLYFARIDEFNFKDNRQHLYVKQTDGSWTSEDDFEIYPFKAKHPSYQIQKLKNLKNFNLKQLEEKIFEEYVDEDIFLNIKEGHQFYDQNLAVVKGDLNFTFINTIQAHINFFYTHHQLKSSRFAKDYFSIGFKASLDEFSNADRILKTYTGYINTPQTSFDDILPEGITQNTIYQDILNADIKKDLYNDLDEAFTMTFLNYMMIFQSFYDANAGLNIIKKYGKDLIETGFDYEDFYLRFILDEDSLINRHLLKDLNNVQKYELILSKIISTAILTLKNNEDLSFNEFIELLERHHENISNKKRSINANHHDVMIKQLIPFDL